MTYTPTIYCSRNNCATLATIEYSAGTVDTELRRAVACDRHRSIVRRWTSRAGTVTATPVDQPLLGQLVLFPIPEVP
ncbi:hypothetical protein [Actinoplanes xinjiangensis]|uniref:hypothetical protein n=1 Tax=Actinoplanes xinjiangensis TaxID=512350 RepID=UPI003448939D